MKPIKEWDDEMAGRGGEESVILLTAQVKRKALGGVKLVYSLLQAVAGTFAFCKTAQLSKVVSMSTTT